MSLTISLATRGRPQRLLDTIQRTLPMIALDTTRIVVGIDNDDPETIEAIKLFADDPRVVPYIGDREDNIGDKWNRCLLFRAALYMVQADYTPVVTPAFDRKLLEAAAVFPDGIGCVYGHMANLSFPSAQAVTQGLVDKLGWMYPPYFPYWFVDHWLDDIARLIDRIAFADVTLASPANKITTQEFREPAFWGTFFDSMRLMRRRQARAIVEADDFTEPPWRKRLLVEHYPLVEHRSQWINDQVRRMTASPIETGGGARYVRLREQAVRMMQAEWPALEAELLAAA